MLKCKRFFLLGVLLATLFISSPAFADTSSVDEIVIDVPSSCSLESTGNTSHTANIANGNSTANIGTTTLKAYCNDDNGFAIYAIGYTDNTEGKNVLTSSTLGSDYDIITGTTMSGTSKWAMKLATSGTATYPITLQNNFNDYHDVPDDYTLVAKRTAGTDTGTSATGASLTTTYEAYISTTQPAGTYVGQVKYTLVHPNNAPAPTPPLTNVIASMSKGTQSVSDLKDVITVPTSNNPATDTSNSGVFLYDASLYGTASDASNDYPIYYYRGILDSDLDVSDSTKYGSNGNGAYYPNYVVLSSTGTPTSTDTCWRIVRTTGSGGVKIIYNGYYGATNANSCANSTTNAQTTYNNSSLTVPLNTFSSTKAGKTYTGLQYQNIHAVGYTYSNLAASTATATALSTIFGSTGNDTTTNVNSSVMKKYIEDWYDANLSSYTSILEPDAGFCSDRTIGEGTSWATSMSDSDTIIPYGTSSLTTYYFGSYTRNIATGNTKKPTLSCSRGIVDIYSTSDATGGNKQLSRPIALLTADEVAFAGSGYDGRTSRASSSSSFSYSSFLRSGSFWLLSPSHRVSSGGSYGFAFSSYSGVSSNVIYSTYGVRPAISLKPGTGFASGSGTATDPWVVIAP